MQLNECTIVSGLLDDGIFLFKNGDGPTLYSHEIFHRIIDGTEIAYYSNANGWCEGITEHGIAMVYAYYTKHINVNDKYEPKGKSESPEHDDINLEYLSKKGENFLDILLSKDTSEMLKKIEKYHWTGTYQITDKDHVYDVEFFDDTIKYKELHFNKNFKYNVKTNHGIMIPDAGQLNVHGNIRRADSEIRRYSAHKYLMGYKDYMDIIKRMSFQEFDKNSPLNVFRTDEYEKTTCQSLYDMKNLTYYFIFYDDNAKFKGIINKLPKDYEPKIKIEILDRKDLYKNTWFKFKDLFHGNNLFQDVKLDNA